MAKKQFGDTLYANVERARQAAVWDWASCNGQNDAVETLDALIEGVLHGTLGDDEDDMLMKSMANLAANFDVSELCEIGIEGAQRFLDLEMIKFRGTKDEVAKRVADYVEKAWQ